VSLLIKGGGGVTAFTGLFDVPHSYSGEGNRLVTVGAGEVGLEFTDAPTDLADPVNPGDPVTKNYFDTIVPLITALEYVFDGGMAPLSGNPFGYLRAPFAGTVQSISMFADAEPTLFNIDILKCAYADFPDGLASIVGGTFPELTGSKSMEDSALSGWEVSFDADDIFAFSVQNTDTIALVTIVLKILRS
jgi:hypothetical protein